MKENSVQVYTNKALSGELSFEDGQYVFNYKESETSVVSLTMPIRKSSWNSNKLHTLNLH